MKTSDEEYERRAENRRANIALKSDWKRQYRNQIIRELIEKIGPNATVYSYSRYGNMDLELDYTVEDWLKSQMEGE